MLLSFLFLHGPFHLLNGMNYIFVAVALLFIFLSSQDAVVFFIHPLVLLLVFSLFVYDCISLLLSFLFLCGSFHLSNQMKCISLQFSVIWFFFWVCCCFLFGCAVVFFIHPLVLLFVFCLFLNEFVSLQVFLLGMWWSFLLICCFFFLSFACLCMIVFLWFFVLCLSFGHATVFIPLLLISFIQSNELHLFCFVLFCFVLGKLLSSLFIQSSYCLLIPIDGQNVVVVVLLYHPLSC